MAVITPCRSESGEGVFFGVPIYTLTKYLPEYDEAVYLHMSGGLSATSFGGVVHVSKQTLQEWRKKWPGFDQAIFRGEPARQLYWEQRLKATGRMDCAPVMFALKNCSRNSGEDQFTDVREMTLDAPGLEAAILGKWGAHPTDKTGESK